MTQSMADLQAQLDALEAAPATTPQEIADQNARAVEILTEMHNR